jgi:hypothetical protein
VTDWSRVAPPSPIREIEAQRRRVLELREQLPMRREQRDQAAARVTELERQDRNRMAELMASGKDATSDTETVEAARHQVAGAVRALEALNLAIQVAEDELHALVLKHRARWVERAQRGVLETRAEAQAALATFRAALQRYRDAQQAEGWLREGSGLDRERPAKMGMLGQAVGSERVTGNRQAVDLGIVLGWVEQTLDPPPAKPQAELQPLTPIAPPGAYVG